MFANGEHAEISSEAATDFRNESRHWRHVAVFHPDPGDRRAIHAGCHDAVAIFERRAKRFFDKHVKRSVEHFIQYGGVGEVGGGDDYCIQGLLIEHLARIFVLGNSVFRGLASQLARRWIGISEGSEVQVILEGEIADMFEAHHSTSDEAYAEGIGRGEGALFETVCVRHGAEYCADGCGAQETHSALGSQGTLSGAARARRLPLEGQWKVSRPLAKRDPNGDPSLDDWIDKALALPMSECRV